MTVAGADRTRAVLPRWWQQMARLQRREMHRVVTEMLMVRNMMPLLMKSRNGGRWTPTEKAELLDHLRRMAHLSPYLLALALPGSIIILPVYAWWLDRRRLKRGD